MAVLETAEGIFASRGFRQYFVGQSLSLLGDGLRTLAIPLLAFKLTHSAVSTGNAFICEVAPFSIFALVGGSLADRVDRRRLMITADAIRFAVMAFFAIAYWFGFLTLPMIYVGLIVISISAAAFLGGQSSSIPYLLGRDRTTEAMAALIAAENVSNLVTPVIGGAVFALFGSFPALVINAMTYLASQLSLSRITSLGPDEPHGMPSIRTLGDDVRLGFRTLFGDTGMRAQALNAFWLNIFGFGAYAILIPFLKRDFGATDQQVGLFLGISAVGAVAGATLAGRSAKRWPFGRAVTTAYLIDAFAFLGVVVFNNLWLVGISWAVSSALVNFEIAQIIGFRLRVTPEALVGRVMGAVRLLVLAGMAPGVIAVSWIADHQGPHIAMWICAVTYILLAIRAWLTPAIRDEMR